MFNWPIQTSSSVNICFLDFVLTNMNRRKLRNYKFLCPKLGSLLAIYHKMPEHYKINTYKFVKPKPNSSNKVCLPIYWRRYQICAFPERLEWAMLPYKATEAIMLKTTLEFGKCANFETLLFGLRKWSTEIGNLYYTCRRFSATTFRPQHITYAIVVFVWPTKTKNVFFLYVKSENILKWNGSNHEHTWRFGINISCASYLH